MNWPRLHWIVGLVTLIIFLLTGAYMRHVADVPELHNVPRLLFRSRHLFLLLTAVANLALAKSQQVGRAQQLASALVLVSPVLLLGTFFVDPQRGMHSSPIFRLAMYGLFVAGVLLAIANRPPDAKAPPA